ncbi:GNAT family N-acetyltransferase [Bacteroidota bacterium]
MIKIRKEKSSDFESIKYVNNQAFNQPQEGNVIDKIRNTDSNILSLVAEMDNKIVGHIFFSSVEIEGYSEIKDGMGLAPMAVLPEYQKQGIGEMLINEGITILKEKNVPFIIVLGHEHYYPKFGFEISSKYGIKCQWEGIPDEVFMVMILDKNKMKNVKGVAKYREEWNEAV